MAAWGGSATSRMSVVATSCPKMVAEATQAGTLKQ